MINSFKKLLVCVSVLFLANCKLILSVDPGGQIFSETGHFDCSESSCEYDLAPDGLLDIFTAEAYPGYRFLGWESAFCTEAPMDPCTIVVPDVFTIFDLNVELHAKFEQTIEMIESTFEESDEGWTSTYETPSHQTEGGVNGTGYLFVIPGGDARTSYFIAPEKFLGDLSAYYTLDVSLWSDGGSYYTSSYGYRGDIVISSGDKVASYALGYRPPDSWDIFLIPLQDSEEWQLSEGVESLAEILVAVDKLEIRAEYGVGGDEAGIDNVRLHPF